MKRLRAVPMYIGMLAGVFAAGATTHAQWTPVADGIEYATFQTADPNNLFVARMDRHNANVILDSSIGQGRLSGGTERMTGQFARYQDAINFWGQSWGQRNQVVVAINGDFWWTDTGIPQGGQIQSSWYAKRFGNLGGGSGFAWKLDRSLFIGPCVGHTPSKQVVKYLATGITQQFSGINTARVSNALTIYTPQFDATTLTDNSGAEVLVELTRPMLLAGLPGGTYGYIRQIRDLAGSTPIPFDHVVLSAIGTARTTLLANATVGAQVLISQEISNYQEDCNTPLPGLDWTKTYASITGNYEFLRYGVVQNLTDEGAVIRNPRTAIAYNDDYIFFLVVDGRDPGTSEGMNMAELGNFCQSVLGATDGINQDGGGSSTMVVNGSIMNNPSDGSERAVANGMMMIVVQPMVRSTVHQAGEAVATNASASVRLGPGTNYAVLTTLAQSTQVTILDHGINGVNARGYNWWKCQSGSINGWIAESLLGTDPPTILLQPVDQQVPIGSPASFAVRAGGPGSLSYRWQKNGVDLTDGGHYTGSATSTLTLTSTAVDDVARYRCRVANAYGSTTSAEAALTTPAPPGDFDGDGDVDQEDFGRFQACVTGTGQPQNDAACAAAKLDGDRDVDDDDLTIFLRCMAGPGVTVSPDCGLAPP